MKIRKILPFIGLLGATAGTSPLFVSCSKNEIYLNKHELEGPGLLYKEGLSIKKNQTYRFHVSMLDFGDDFNPEIHKIFDFQFPDYPIGCVFNEGFCFYVNDKKCDDYEIQDKTLVVHILHKFEKTDKLLFTTSVSESFENARVQFGW